MLKGVTEKTASVHVSHILAKLDARNRGEAAHRPPAGAHGVAVAAAGLWPTPD